MRQPATPEPLRKVEGEGLALLLLATFMAALELVQWLHFSTFGGLPPQGLPAAVAGLGAAVWAARLWPAVKAGVPWSRALRASLLAPPWWRWWFPEALRRPETAGVWERLPWILRLHRWLQLATPLALFFGALLLLAFGTPRVDELKAWPRLRDVFMYPPMRHGYRPYPPIGPFALGLGWMVTALAATTTKALASVALARRGLSAADRRGLLEAPLARAAFWGKDSIARVLAPAPAPRGAPRADDVPAVER